MAAFSCLLSVLCLYYLLFLFEGIECLKRSLTISSMLSDSMKHLSVAHLFSAVPASKAGDMSH